MRDLPYRRKQRRKAKDRWSNLWDSWYKGENDYEPLTPYEKGVGSSCRKRCSCWMCRNRRQDEGITRQEQKAELDFRESSIEAGI